MAIDKFSSKHKNTLNRKELVESLKFKWGKIVGSAVSFSILWYFGLNLCPNLILNWSGAKCFSQILSWSDGTQCGLLILLAYAFLLWISLGKQKNFMLVSDLTELVHNGTQQFITILKQIYGIVFYLYGELFSSLCFNIWRGILKPFVFIWRGIL